MKLTLPDAFIHLFIMWESNHGIDVAVS